MMIINSYRYASTAAWTPADLANLLAWFDASDTGTITESGGSVSQWDDKSGNANHVTQGTGSDQPTTRAVTLNSLNVISTNDSSDYLNKSSFDIGTSGNLMIATVLRMGNSALSFSWMFAMDAVNDFQVGKNTDSGVYVTIVSGNLGILTDSGSNNWADTDIIVSVVFDFSNTSFDLYVNGTNEITSNLYNLKIDQLTNLILLNRRLLGRSLDGYMGEYITGLDIDTTSRQKAEGYLAHKWGLTANLPAGHPYKSTAP